MLEGEQRGQELTAMRLEALRVMRGIRRFRPRLIGSVLTGHIRSGSDIDLHVFTDSLGLLEDAVTEMGLEYQVEHKRVLKFHEQRVFTHVHMAGPSGKWGVELTVYPTDKIGYPFKSSITGKLIERAEIHELEAMLRKSVADLELELERIEERMDVWDLYAMLLRPLEQVKQNPHHHPEADALHHSLQVFDLARQERGYDEEFLLAALLHDVGKGIDPRDHVGAGLEALEGAISERTAWLIKHHMEAHAYRDRTLGQRARRRLEESEDLEDLLLLSELDKAGRRGGVVVPTIEESLAYIRHLQEGST